MPCKANRHAPCKPCSRLAVASASPSINATPHQTNPCHARVATAVHCKLSSRYTSNCLWLAKPTATNNIGSHCSSYQPGHLIKTVEYQVSSLAAIRHHAGHHGKALLLAHLLPRQLCGHWSPNTTTTQTPSPTTPMTLAVFHHL